MAAGRHAITTDQGKATLEARFVDGSLIMQVQKRWRCGMFRLVRLQ